jgi:hypothetical protein
MAIKRRKPPQTGEKAKGTKPKLKFTDKAESERFIEAARKLGIEETSVTSLSKRWRQSRIRSQASNLLSSF